METLLQDVRYTLRMLRRAPGFTVVAVVTLALGIGASAAIFSVVHAVVLEPLPYHEPQRLVQLWMRFTGIGIPNDQNWVSAPELRDLERNGSLSALAAVESASSNVTFRGGAPRHVAAALVSPSLFQVLGVRAQAGRTFVPEEGVVGRDRVVLLGDGLWRRYFGADPAVVGRRLVMSGRAYSIVGVLPRGFQYPREVELWAPLAFTAGDLAESERGNHGLQVVARMRPGLSLEQTRADLAAVGRRIESDHPDFDYRQSNFTVLAVPLLDQQIGDIRTALWVLLGAVGLVLAIACANVANLLVGRAAARQREMAVRQALGVGRWRLVRQLLTESAVLGLCGGVGGLLLAAWTVKVLVATTAASFPRMDEVRLDPAVFAFALAVSLGTGVLFGLAPIVALWRRRIHGALKEGGRGGSDGAASHRLRGALVVAEIAMALALLAGSGLLIRSFLRLEDVDAGFRADHVLTLRTSLPEERYAGPAQTHAFYRELVARVASLPGVEAVGAASGLPLTGNGWSGGIAIDTQQVPEKARTPEADQRPVTPGYFAALRIPLLRGRLFDERDHQGAAPVCIVDETLARTYWPHADAVGQHIRQGGPTSPWMTVVGVVRHVRYRTLESPSRVELYWPFDQTRFAQDTMSLAIRSTREPAALTAAVRRAVEAIDPNQAVFRIRTLDELVADSVARRRLSMLLLAVFAAVALLLAAVGIYGVLSQSVGERAHEIGIRIALGARATQVVDLVLRRSLALALTGIALGLAGTMLLTRLLGSLLFAVKPYDPATFLAVTAGLLLVAATASLLPARRAAAVDPVEALRRE